MNVIPLVLLALPPIALLVMRLTKLPGLGRRRHYLLFTLCGAVHGLLLYAALVVSEWRAPRDWGATFAVVSSSALRVSAYFLLGYLVLAVIVDLASRFETGWGRGE
ncbi:MAG: hypothetical protein R3244_08880 [Thermoanaerobaculia bacterium]|nr:hypothetical protein [Thermoanaerobaculia bacterium]